MWIAREANPFGRLSIRNLLLFVAAVCAASFAYILMAAPVTHAADVKWNGDSLMYGKDSYVRQADAPEGNSMGLEKGTHLYTFTEDAPTNGGAQKTHFIYFAPSVDPTKATSASYAVYDFTPPDIFKNPTDKKTISLSAKTAEDSKTTSCAVQGIGWIVCPVTDFFAGAMDWLFNILSGFLTVRPVQTSQTNSLYRAWSYMRNFANVAFVISFLVIIFSQVSNIGISNYGIKKILPRLVIAAVLVNISYWICAIAIDISNIVGYSIQDIFISMRNGLVGTEGNSWNVTSWRSITGFVLSGGTALTALGIGTFSALAGAGGAIYLLLPILLGVLMAVLVALLVLAARQAIITILVIVSPLAFVAYILPNTEKYFKRWHELGTTLLVMFPAFSVVFGGAQLAGTAIIQNADSINLLILGMAVQVAPLAITPLLMRVSGSLLTKIAGVVNNPKRGMVDRTRNWANGRAEDHKARNLGRTDLKRRNFMARSAQAIDTRNRKREGWRKANEASADATWENSEEAHKIHAASAKASLRKSVGESAAEAHFEALRHSDASIQNLELQARANKLNVDLSKAKVEADWSEMRAGNSRSMVVPENLSVEALASYAHARNNMASSLRDTSQEAELENLRKRSAERIYSKQFTSDLLENKKTVDGKELLAYSGGIAGAEGESTVLSGAVKEFRSEYIERIGEKQQLLKHFNLETPDIQKLALGKNVTGERIEADGRVVKYEFKASDAYAREAAIDTQLKTGSFSEVQKIISESGEVVIERDASGKETGRRQGTTYGYRTSIKDVIKEYKIDSKAVFLGSQTINDIAHGRIGGEEGLNMAAARSISTGKITKEDVSGMKRAALERLYTVTAEQTPEWSEAKTAAERDAIKVKFDTRMDALRKSAWSVLNTPVLSRNAEQESIEVLRDVVNKYGITSDD
jgi:hypothetical protein